MTRIELKGSVLLLALALAGGCSHHSPSRATGRPDGAASAVASAATAPRSSQNPRRPIPEPSGPKLAILAGKGVGPIRLGATVATVERLMQMKCDVRTPTVCRYINRAVEFELKDGKTVAIHIQRLWRPAGTDAHGKKRLYGQFYGAIPPDIMLGMRPWAVRKGIGKPLSVEKVTTPNPNHTIEIDHYKGMTLQYDKLDNGNTALGEISIPN